MGSVWTPAEKPKYILNVHLIIRHENDSFSASEPLAMSNDCPVVIWYNTGNLFPRFRVQFPVCTLKTEKSAKCDS